MADPDWYPQRRADRPAWHANFNTEAVASGTTLNLTAPQVAQITLDATAVQQVVDYTEAIDAFRQEVTAFASDVLEGDPLAPLRCMDCPCLSAVGSLSGRGVPPRPLSLSACITAAA